jgi:hypothetical protein
MSNEQTAAQDRATGRRASLLAYRVKLPLHLQTRVRHVEQKRHLEGAADEREPLLGLGDADEVSVALADHVLDQPVIRKPLLQRPVHERQRTRRVGEVHWHQRTTRTTRHFNLHCRRRRRLHLQRVPRHGRPRRAHHPTSHTRASLLTNLKERTTFTNCAQSDVARTEQ